ncbi:MAG TPA: hypothetical protein VIB98_06675, partial [Gemmatimonadaceae bacterium]
MRHSHSVLIAIALLAAPASAQRVAASSSVGPVEIVRCAESSDVPCVRATIPLRPDEARALADTTGAAEWLGEIANVPLRSG